MSEELRDKLAKTFYKEDQIRHMSCSPDSGVLATIDENWEKTNQDFWYRLADAAIEVFYERSRKA